MISLALATALAASAAQAGPPPQLRQAYTACLSSFKKAKLSEKLDDASFRSGAKAACASQEVAVRNSIVTYDVKMRMKKAVAEEGAAQQVDDYLANMAESYQLYANPKPK
jgi:hypothetical protein